MKTTLYNHKELGTPEKPLIKNIQYKKLIERIEAGDTDCYHECFKHFTLEPGQMQVLRTIFLQSKNKKDGNRA